MHGHSLPPNRAVEFRHESMMMTINRDCGSLHRRKLDYRTLRKREGEGEDRAFVRANLIIHSAIASAYLFLSLSLPFFRSHPQPCHEARSKTPQTLNKRRQRLAETEKGTFKAIHWYSLQRERERERTSNDRCQAMIKCAITSDFSVWPLKFPSFVVDRHTDRSYICEYIAQRRSGGERAEGGGQFHEWR